MQLWLRKWLFAFLFDMGIAILSGCILAGLLSDSVDKYTPHWVAMFIIGGLLLGASLVVGVVAHIPQEPEKEGSKDNG